MKRRLLMMIDESSVGGGQRHLLDLVERIDPAHYEIAVACPGEGYLADTVRERGVELFPVRMANRPSLSDRASCLRALRRFRPDLVHTHGGTAGVYGRLSAHKIGARTVHTYHGLHYLHFARGLRRFGYHAIDRYLARRTTCLICVADADLALAEAHGLAPEGKAHLIRNGIDTDRFTSSAEARSVRRAGMCQSDRLVIGTVGRLHRQKGQASLIDAARIVVERDSRARFVIVGEGEERGALEKRITATGLAGRFELIGARYDIPELLSEFDLFVLPSLWEGLPLTLLEAMAVGLPVVATSVDGIVEVVRDGMEGRLVPPNDAAALADALVDLLGSPERIESCGRRAVERVRSAFSIGRMIDETEAVYRKALA